VKVGGWMMGPTTFLKISAQKKKKKKNFVFLFLFLFFSPPPMNTLVLDNGAYSLKLAWAHLDTAPVVVPNCSVRSRALRGATLLGDQLDELRDASGLVYRRPIDRGVVTDWDLQRALWGRAMGLPEVAEGFPGAPAPSVFWVFEF
jgi:hypothetical protein